MDEVVNQVDETVETEGCLVLSSCHIVIFITGRACRNLSVVRRRATSSD
jgi:hypothetical protein